MVETVNEIFTLITQITTFIFSIGVMIFIFRFQITREGAQEKFLKTVSNQYSRLKNKTIHLFILGTITIFYSIIGKIFIQQVLVDVCLLWILLILGLLLIGGCFLFFYRLISEIINRE